MSRAKPRKNAPILQVAKVFKVDGDDKEVMNHMYFPLFHDLNKLRVKSELIPNGWDIKFFPSVTQFNLLLALLGDVVVLEIASKTISSNRFIININMSQILSRDEKCNGLYFIIND